MATRAQIEPTRVRFQQVEGTAQLQTSPCRFVRAGLLARQAVLRLTKPLAVRESLLEDRFLAGLKAMALDTAACHRAASWFPEPLAPGLVADLPSEFASPCMHADDHGMTPFLQTHGFGLSSRFGGDSSVRERDRDAGAAEVDHRDQGVGGVESVGAV